MRAKASHAGMRLSFRRALSAVALASVLAAGLVAIPSSPATAAVTTTPVSGEAGSNTAVTVSGNQIREGASLSPGATIGIGTSALLNPGVGAREIRTKYDANTVYQAGTARAPEGWTLAYSTNGGSTWLSSEPTPASAVTDIKASAASVAAGAIDGYSQQYSTETTAAVPNGNFSSAPGGDGWGVAFLDNYIFNVFHHNDSKSTLECHLRTTAATCTGYPADLTTVQGNSTINYRSAGRSDVEVDAANGFVFSFTAPTSGTYANIPGILCANVNAAPTTCGFTPLHDVALIDAFNDLSTMVKVGNRIFAVARTNGTAQSALLCFEVATRSKCVGSPMLLGTNTRIDRQGNTTNSDSDIGAPPIRADGDRVFTRAGNKLGCYFASTLQNCSNAWPVEVGTANIESELVIHNTVTVAQGTNERTIVADGICIRDKCLNYDGSTNTDWVNPLTITAVDATEDRWFEGVTTLGRFYGVSYAVAKCFDFATEAPCANFSSITFGLLYQIIPDPENPNCLWTNSNHSGIKNFDALTGAAGCSRNPVVTLQPSQFAPRYACSTEQGIDQWRVLKISNLVGTGTVSAVKLTVRNPLGTSVAGFTNLPVTVGQDLDLSGMNVALSGSRPTFSFAFTLAIGTVTSATIAVDYAGKGPELCSSAQLSSPSANTAAVIRSFFADSVGGGNSFESARNFTISSTTVAPPATFTVPSAPRNLVGSGLNTNATLSFSPPLDNGGLDLGSYQISIDGGTTYTNITNFVDNGDGTLSTSLTNLTAGQTYPIRIAATNSLGRSLPASLTLTVQLVDFSNIPDTAQNAGPIYLATQRSAGFPYTYTAGPSSICSINANVVTLIAVGACNLVQNQAGDSTNIPTQASASFNVLANPTVVTAPSAPLSLTATPASTQVSLAWSAPANLGNGAVTDYVIQYKVGTSWVPFVDGASTNTFAVVPSLTNGTLYSFKVAAVNSAGQGAFSSVVDARPAGAPAAVTALSATQTGTAASVSWAAPASNGGSAITDYIVEYKLSEASIWSLFADAVSTSTSANVTGLQSGATYDFQVTARNAVTVGPSVSTVTLSVVAGNGALDLAWQASSDVANIVDHRVRYRLVGESTWTEVATGSANRTAAVTGLINGSEYEVQVARLLTGGSTSSFTSVVRAKPFSYASAPTLSVVAGTAQVTLNWVAPVANGSVISDYFMRYRATGTTPWIALTDGVSLNTSSVIIGLTNGTSYDFQVAAINSAGLGAFSATAVARPRKTPGPITGLTLTSSAAGLSASWIAPVDNGGAPITDYEVQYKEVSSSVWRTIAHAPTTATNYSIANLVVLTSYSVRVAAVNEAGIGAFGASDSEVTLALPTVNQTTGSQQGGTSTVVADPMPKVDPSKIEPKYIKQYANEKVVLEFLTLTDVNSVVIDGKTVPFVLVNGQLTLTDPGLDPGQKDIRITGSWGTITLSERLVVLKAAAIASVPRGASLTITKFAGGSSKLTARMKTSIKLFVGKNRTKSALVCSGYTSGPTVLGVDPALASARAKAVCTYAKTLNQKVVFSTRGFNTLTDTPSARRALMTFLK